jgi:hypothetical protein
MWNNAKGLREVEIIYKTLHLTSWFGLQNVAAFKIGIGKPFLSQARFLGRPPIEVKTGFAGLRREVGKPCAATIPPFTGPTAKTYIYKT